MHVYEGPLQPDGSKNQTIAPDTITAIIYTFERTSMCCWVSWLHSKENYLSYKNYLQNMNLLAKSIRK